MRRSWAEAPRGSGSFAATQGIGARVSNHRLSAIVSADVAGYSGRMAGDEDATIQAVTAARPLAEALAQEHRGRLVDFTGDNFLGEFPSGVDAVRFSLAFQRRERASALPFRVGIHIGDVRVDGERIFGNGVNVSARLQALATSGGICLSAVVRDQIQGKLDLELEDLGPQPLKNIPEPIHALRVAGMGEGGARTRRSSGRRWVLSAAALLVVAAAGLLAWPSGGPAPTPAPGRRPLLPSSIAVLPFLDLSEGADRKYLADGLTEELISSLARNPSLRVVARSSVFAFEGRGLDVRQIGEQLGVGSLLEGSVRTSGDRLRVTAQLVRARDGFHLWTQSYDRDMGDLFAVQIEIANRIREEIEPELGLVLGAPGTPRAPDPRAYRAQLEARYHWNRRPEGLTAAVALFEEALGYDPGYAAAWAGLAGAYLAQWTYLPDPDRVDELLGQARHAIGEALFLDDQLGLAHTALGTLRGFELRWAESEAAFRRAVELDPGHAETHYNLSVSLVLAGRVEEAREVIARAVDLDPLSPIMLRHAGLFALFAGDSEAARELARRSLALKPGEFRARVLLARSHLAEGDERGAIEAYAQGTPFWLRPLTRIGGRLLGPRRSASLLLGWSAIQTGQRCTPIPEGGAWAAAFVGDARLMVHCLNEAADLRRVGFMQDPVFDPHRDLPEFRAYLERVGLAP